jgi:DNA polymerase elongation subunit (family B)
MEFPRQPYPALLKNQPLEFQITDIYIPEADKFKEKDDDEYYSIILYGTCENGATVCADVISFMPFFYIKPPESWENLSDNDFNNKVEELKATMMSGTYQCRYKTDVYDRRIIPNKFAKHFHNISVVNKKDFWGFTNNKIFRFMKITVKSLKLFTSLKYYFKTLEKEGFKQYESNIDPFLRFIHIQDIRPCGWVRIEKYTINDDITRCDYNIQVRHNNVKPIDINKIAPLIITSFDIECSSSHGDFPVAIKNYSKVAQDLALVVKAGYEFDKGYIVNWIQNMFLDTIVIDEETDLKINRVYTKKPVTSEFIKSVPMLLEPVIKEILAILTKISSSVSNNDDEDDDENLTVRQLNEEEEKITKLLDSVLPKLEGDKIIQIGTTVHRYGSDDIIYKNIVTLNTCNKIEDCDVVACKTEKEVLVKWKELMNNLNSDIVTGYNIFGFDMEYIWNRAKENNILEDFSIGLGRLITKKSTLVEQKLSSSALGDNILKYMDMDGVVLVDLLKVMQRDHKLDSYKLDNVSSIFLGDKKNDLKPQEIFEKFKGTAEDRCIIAKYCIQDCCLVNRLVHKLKILENNIGMGNVCLVPLNYLFRRGQGIKIFSLIAKQCMEKESLIPVIKSYNENVEVDDDGYEGAVVLEPKQGIYLNEPIVVFDYGSLYPSSMIARNLSHDTYVLDKKYMILDDPNIDYMKVSYDIYEGVGDKKKKTGVKECIFAQYNDGRKGIIPEILNMLLQERKNTRKKIEYQTAVLKDGSEVFGTFTEKDDIIEYHNIDTGNTTIVNKADIVSTKDTYNRFEQDVFDSLQLAYKVTANSLYGQIGARTSSVYLKDIAASTTATGREMIMLAKDFVETNYNAEVIYGDSVMPYTPITYLLNDNEIIVNTFENIQFQGLSWFDYSQFKPNDIDRFDKEQLVPSNMKVWTHNGWAKVKRIIRHKTTKKIYRVLTHTGLVDVTEDHSLLDKNCQIIKPSQCVIGQELLHSQPDLQYELNCSFDEDFHDLSNNKTLKFSSNNQVKAQTYCILLQKMGYKVYISSEATNDICLTYTKIAISDNHTIKKIEILYEAYDGYVYDIETEEGVFHAGIGNMILKNTDSIFCKFPLIDSEGNTIYGKDSLPYAIKIGQHVEKNIAKIMPKPQKLNYEKCLYPFILFSKKRYVGNLYETDVNKFKQKSMGIVLKRRDNANIVKKVYGGIIDIILNKQDLNHSIEFLQEELNDLVNGKSPITDLIITKSLRASYKDATKIAHKVLADRIGARDPGNRPVVNDRIPFVYIKTSNPNALQGDRIENPDFILQNNLTPDYLHYITNQIMKPVLQLYALCLDQLPGYDKDDSYWDIVDTELRTKTLYEDDTRRMARIENLKLNLVKELLFEKYINMLSEPKVRKTRAATKTKNTQVTNKACHAIIEELPSVPIITTDFIDATIKVTQSRKTNTITAEAHITNNKKKIWTYKNENVSNKEQEIKTVINKILEYNPTYKYSITINNTPFYKEYIAAVSKYNEMLKNKEVDVLNQAFQDQNIEKIKDIGKMLKFEDLIIIKDRFILKTK